jgi:hypothetical protein
MVRIDFIIFPVFSFCFVFIYLFYLFYLFILTIVLPGAGGGARKTHKDTDNLSR